MHSRRPATNISDKEERRKDGLAAPSDNDNRAIQYRHRPLVPRWFMYILTRDPSRTGAGKSGAGSASFLSFAFVALFGRIAECAAVCRKIETTLHRRCQVACVVARIRPVLLTRPIERTGTSPVLCTGKEDVDRELGTGTNSSRRQTIVLPPRQTPVK